MRSHKKYTGANIDIVLQKLKNLKPSPLIEASEIAIKACRKVNAELKDD